MRQVAPTQGVFPRPIRALACCKNRSLTSSQAIIQAVQELLYIQESDLAHDGWERPTRTLLECAAQAS